MRVELKDEFDRNFSTGSFFGKRWKRKLNREPSYLQHTGKLRSSIRAKITNNSVEFSSSQPYAEIHNTGGEIEVTEKMKRFFWYKYKSTIGEVKTLKNGKRSASKASKSKSSKANMWKGLALKKVGSKIIIPQRQYIGMHPQVQRTIEEIVNENITEACKNMSQK